MSKTDDKNSVSAIKKLHRSWLKLQKEDAEAESDDDFTLFKEPQPEPEEELAPIKKKTTKKKKGKAAKTKDPMLPKKAKSAYLFFSTENRPVIKAQNPDATFGDLGKLVGAAWKKADKETKAKYQKMNEDDQVRYAEDMKNYTPSQPKFDEQGNLKPEFAEE